MKIAVSYYLRFAENVLNMSTRAVLYLQSYYISYHFLSIFCFLMTSLH